MGCGNASLSGSPRFEGMRRLNFQCFFIDLDPRIRRQCFLTKRRIPEDGNLFTMDDKMSGICASI